MEMNGEKKIANENEGDREKNADRINLNKFHRMRHFKSDRLGPTLL